MEKQPLGSFDFSYFVELFGTNELWSAAGTTVGLATVAWASAAVIGLLIAQMSRSRRLVVRGTAWAYVWIFRGVPMLLLIIFAFTAVPQLLPSTRDFLANPLYAGGLAIIVSESAFMAEIFRGALMGVPQGQVEAGRALGLTQAPIQRLIVLPQALRIAVPPLGNEWIATLKNTSLVSVIALVELTLAAQRIYSQNFKITETLIVVAIFYLAMATVFSIAQAHVERRLDVTRTGPSWFGRRGQLPRLRSWLSAPDGSGEAIDADRPERALDEGDAPTNGELLTPFRRVKRPRQLSSEVMVAAKGVTKRFDKLEVLSEVDLEVRRGEVVTLIGPSGSGKTTLIRCLNALEMVDGGTVEVNSELIGLRRSNGGRPRPARDRDVARQRAQIGMLFQQFNLFPHRTAIDNVTLAPKNLGVASADQLDRRGQIGRAHV